MAALIFTGRFGHAFMRLLKSGYFCKILSKPEDKMRQVRKASRTVLEMKGCISKMTNRNGFVC